MIDDFKYFSERKEDHKVGVSLLSVGYQEILSNESYPPQTHPIHHLFNWDKGRKIDEYQLIYIEEGKGYLETRESGPKRVMAGDYFLLYPGIWHRYKPFMDKG